MIKGKVIIDFQADEEGEYSWNIFQEGEELSDEDLINLFEKVFRDINLELPEI
jgi:hypothetical protein